MTARALLSTTLDASWSRSQSAGLSEWHSPEELRLDKSQLQQRLHKHRGLIELVDRYAFPLFEQLMAHRSSRLILSDIDGFVIDFWGAEKYADKLANIALETGVNWSENYKGTNAIGTAIAMQQPVSVIGEQHFIKHHRFMSCSASPIFSPKGEMVAVLDITSEQHRHNQQTMLLISSLAQQVETAMLCQLPDSHYRIDVAPQAHLLDSGWQGIVVADSEGKILGHNPMAQQLIKRMKIGESIDFHLGEQWHQSASNKQTKLHLQTKALKPAHSVVSSVKNASNPSLLAADDARMQKAWWHANKVIAKSIPLLILGETGVGKEQFVKRLHKYSGRSQQVLQAVNCAALPTDLLEAELFGYQAGAFTGANPKGYLGKIRQADGGFLFLDEIGEMPLAAQSRLLRVLQEREVVPVGGNQCYPVNIQVVAATHVDLQRQVKNGLFREDLYYRLNGLQIVLPALRERSDINALVSELHSKYSVAQTICSELNALLLGYDWPGNLRELDNFMQVACLMSEHKNVLQWDDLPESLQLKLSAMTKPSQPDNSNIKQCIDDNIARVYQHCKGNISKSAEQLGISRTTLYRKLKKLQLIR
ncbi:sigma-54-dependent Fis family transcriptional regulator [Agarivorans sp. MS3-6]|uniref:sigma-54-dependent Fis family transcriptional regulator n=1 Tax=Agarivorans sp. TSD2052 TaxID=2937286 RepID=UPI00200F2C47|nr:sigma-54-dependent Fis family transcriptional regulator [Agarivorans sp. TSD2052]UPW17360.1 sigma-54-dependent Fis family transcriptional regulator [Agarivorans sp. TSD2052]